MRKACAERLWAVLGRYVRPSGPLAQLCQGNDHCAVLREMVAGSHAAVGCWQRSVMVEQVDAADSATQKAHQSQEQRMLHWHGCSPKTSKCEVFAQELREGHCQDLRLWAPSELLAAALHLAASMRTKLTLVL